MKKFTLLLILALGFTYVHCQWAVKLYKYRDFRQFNSSNDQITVMEMDHQGNIWFNLDNVEEGAGMGKFTGKEWVIFNIGSDLINREMGLSVNAFAFDLLDNVWVGTDNGLAQFDGISPVGWIVYNMSNSPIPDNKITAIAVDNKNIKWIGCSNGMLASFDGSKWMIIDKYYGAGNEINDLETDIDGNIWVARNGTPGLVKFNGEYFTEFDKLTDIRNIMVDEKGLVNVISKGELIIILNNEIVETVQPDPRLECELYEVAFHPDGPCVSSNKGILQKIGSAFKFYSNANSSLPELVPPDNYNPVPLIYDGDNGLWFSFIYQGITGTSYASIGHMYRILIPLPVITSDKPSFRFCFGESITLNMPEEADIIVLDDERTILRTLTLYDTRTIQFAFISKEICLKDTLSTCLESSQGTSDTVTIDIIAQHVFEDEEPCVATVSPDYKNLVAWEKTPYKGTASYNIYRETEIPDDYEFIANIPVGQWSFYKDNLSSPRLRSYKYKIASVDTCGNPSGPSYYHKTMHLQLSANIDSTEFTLSWDNYEGVWFPYYIIFKGPGPDNLFPVDSLPWDAEILSWTDYNVTDHYYYGIGVRLPGICAPATGEGKKADSGPYSQSMSQIEDNRFQTFISEEGIAEIRSYPNPFINWTQIDFENPGKQPYQLTVTDMSGKIVRIINNILDNNVILLRENMPQGFYLFELKGEKVYRGKFVVK